MSYKLKYVLVLAFISVLLPLPGAIANLCGCTQEVLLPLASFPILFLAPMVVVCTPISLCLIVVAIGYKQWNEAGLLVVSLFFPLAVFYVIGLVNKLGYDGVMSV